MNKSRFTLYCKLDQESDSAAVYAERARASMKMFGEISAPLRSWMVLDPGAIQMVPVEKADNAFARIIAPGFFASSQLQSPGSLAEFRVMGAGRRSFSGVGAALFNVEFDDSPDPRIVSYPVFKAIMTSLAPIWKAHYVRAYTDAIREYWDDPSRVFDLSCMVYLSESLAHMIDLPENVHAEPVTGGGVVLSAVEGDFDVTNPEHMAAARRIRDVLNPLNGLYKMP